MRELVLAAFLGNLGAVSAVVGIDGEDAADYIPDNGRIALVGESSSAYCMDTRYAAKHFNLSYCQGITPAQQAITFEKHGSSYRIKNTH